jgi:hypothetical protein
VSLHPSTSDPASSVVIMIFMGDIAIFLGAFCQVKSFKFNELGGHRPGPVAEMTW